MNSQPLPPPPDPDALIRRTGPTAGSMVGSIVGAALCAKLNISMPLEVAAIVGFCSAIATAGLHWASAQLKA